MLAAVVCAILINTVVFDDDVDLCGVDVMWINVQQLQWPRVEQQRAEGALVVNPA